MKTIQEKLVRVRNSYEVLKKEHQEMTTQYGEETTAAEAKVSSTLEYLTSKKNPTLKWPWLSSLGGWMLPWRSTRWRLILYLSSNSMKYPFWRKVFLPTYFTIVCYLRRRTASWSQSLNESDILSWDVHSLHTFVNFVITRAQSEIETNPYSDMGTCLPPSWWCASFCLPRNLVINMSPLLVMYNFLTATTLSINEAWHSHTDQLMILASRIEASRHL